MSGPAREPPAGVTAVRRADTKTLILQSFVRARTLTNVMCSHKCLQDDVVESDEGDESDEESDESGE